MRYDFTVVFRIYPGVTKSPLFFKDSKLDMVTAMVDSFKRSIDDLIPFVYVLLDGCPDIYQKIFEDRFPAEHLEIINLDKIGNYGTFNKQMELLTKQDKSDIVYLAEDDYLYRDDALKKCVLKMKNDDSVDFMSPYDHKDYYTLALHNHPVRVEFSDDCHWREANSTCLTFFTRKSVLLQTMNVFHFFSEGLHDAPVWLILTRFNMFHPIKLFKLRKIQKSYARWIVKGWKFGWKTLLFGRRYRLITPIPAAATHLEGPLVSPGVNWNNVKENLQAE